MTARRLSIERDASANERLADLLVRLRADDAYILNEYQIRLFY